MKVNCMRVLRIRIVNLIQTSNSKYHYHFENLENLPWIASYTPTPIVILLVIVIVRRA